MKPMKAVQSVNPSTSYTQSQHNFVNPPPPVLEQKKKFEIAGT